MGSRACYFLITLHPFRLSQWQNVWLKPLHPNIGVLNLYTVLCAFHKDKDNFFKNQDLLKLEIISFILVTLKCNLGRTRVYKPIFHFLIY